MNFDGTSSQVLFRSLSHPFGLDVHHDKLYWTDWKKTSIFQGSKYGGRKSVLKKETEYLYGVRIFTKENQAGTICYENMVATDIVYRFPRLFLDYNTFSLAKQIRNVRGSSENFIAANIQGLQETVRFKTCNCFSGRFVNSNCSSETELGQVTANQCASKLVSGMSLFMFSEFVVNYATLSRSSSVFDIRVRRNRGII